MITSDPFAAAPTVEYDAGRADRLRVLESHNSTWMFDEVDHEFCRVPRGSDEGAPTVWRRYDRLIIQPDSDAFLVFLDAAGSRLLRGRQHVAPCNECEVTQEFSIEELRSLTNPS
jgi:hypothetical protein